MHAVRFLRPLALAALCVAGCRQSTPEEAAFSKARRAHDRGEYTEAAAQLGPLAAQGHPAAQLLLARMYALGRGVPANAEKAEQLRSLAALRIVTRGLTDDQRSMASPLVGSLNLDSIPDPDPGPAGTANHKAIQTLDIAMLEKLAAEIQSNFNEKSVPAPPAPSPAEPAPVSAARVEPVAESSAPEIPHTLRQTQAISLSQLQHAAGRGDVPSMELLSVAHARGFYGLKMNPQQAALWRERAQAARNAALHRPHKIRDFESVPVGRLGGMILAGVALIGLGLWHRRWTRRAPKAGARPKTRKT